MLNVIIFTQISLCFLCFLWLSCLVSDAFLDEHCQARCADQLAAFVGDLDLPNAHRPSRIDRFGLDGDDALAHGPQVIGVDLDADRRDFFKIGPGYNADRRGGFGQKERNAAVHDAGVLMHLRRHLHRHHHALGRGQLDLYAEELEQFVFGRLPDQFGFVHLVFEIFLCGREGLGHTGRRCAADDVLCGESRIEAQRLSNIVVNHGRKLAQLFEP